MKKIFTLICAVMASMAMFAADELTGLPVGEEIKYAGKLGRKLELSENLDWTSYDYIWVKYKGMTGKIQFGVIYSDWQKDEVVGTCS